MAHCVERAPTRNYGRFMNFNEDIMTTKTRTIVALATLSLATAACAINDQASGSADAAATASVPSSVQHLAPSTPGVLAAGSRVQDGIRTTVLEFRNTGSARHEAEYLLGKAYEARRGAIACDLHKQYLSLAGVPGAQGVDVDNRTGTGSST
ncbi:MAG: hypothetical protein QOE60_1274 [Thermoleophilaceae bacterium]|nr:hypothetical protein [Thermoleophilaceae bacterium]